MFVCLCNGITSQVVADAIAGGASTTKEISKACGAGAECGRCRRTLRLLLGAQGGDRKRLRL
ncbi:(2Fe-2S)-binding protein [Mycobacterium cookii]|uniref:Bacterioferritin-associated ferredoxin n=1 Tax=Mycobacterium cookii TaxID=1775 RepID=A0A7I7KWC2_9MYCO|nr:(2Fe-2S)-binding protein [Mycobacterium cookii]MCV7332213.1 (2Fe-2S)-binding protein [Mycobacterium cookii]BBX46360.1 (2Fe-2S)-binding protein [Mycobacterium cookii]